MHRKFVGLAAVAALSMLAFATGDAGAQSQGAKVEYLDIRWDGVDRMCVVYPDGHVVFFGQELKDFKRPDDANKRAFYLTIEANRLAAQGWEIAGFISDEIIMKRAVH